MKRLRYLGAALRLLRQERGWTQKELARQTGLDPSQLSRYEGETIEPTLGTLALLLETLGTSFADLEDARRRLAALAARGELREAAEEPSDVWEPHGEPERHGGVVRTRRRGFLVVDVSEELEEGADFDLFEQAVEAVDRFLHRQALEREIEERRRQQSRRRHPGPEEGKPRQ